MNGITGPPPDETVPEPALRWVARSVGGGAAVHSVERLRGGMSSLVHAITLHSGAGGESRTVVLRRFDNAGWLQVEPDLAWHEAESLRRAASVSVDTPALLAFDETGAECGMPAVLMSRLAGAVVLDPPDRHRWLDGLAEALARVHAVEADAFPWHYFPYADFAAWETPAWSRFPGRWDRAIRVTRRPRPDFRPRFIHRDYHPTNVLWSAGRVSGIVDWVNACAGPAGVDVGHCRLNLAQLYGVPAADAFLAAYEKYAGEGFRYDPYWDLASLLDGTGGPPSVYVGWTALGMTGLTDDLMEERIEAYLESLIGRLPAEPV